MIFLQWNMYCPQSCLLHFRYIYPTIFATFWSNSGSLLLCVFLHCPGCLNVLDQFKMFTFNAYILTLEPEVSQLQSFIVFGYCCIGFENIDKFGEIFPWGLSGVTCKRGCLEWGWQCDGAQHWLLSSRNLWCSKMNSTLVPSLLIVPLTHVAC